jgi:anti-sigma-K factor RskA
MAQEKTSTELRITELQANHDRELRAMQAGFEGRLSALKRTMQAQNPNRKFAAAFNR